MPYLLTIFSLFFATLAYAQQNDGTGQASNIYGESFNTRVREIPYTPGKTKGSYYLFENWSPGTITMDNSEEIRDIFLKYNFQDRALEIKTDSAYYSLGAHETKQFTIYDAEREAFRQFASAKRYTIDNTPLTGVLEVLHEGNIGLVARVAPRLIEANYKGALSGGSTSDKIVKEKEYFLVNEYRLEPISNKKKEAIPLLKEYSADVESFVKKAKIKFRHEDDLVDVVRYLDQEKR